MKIRFKLKYSRNKVFGFTLNIGRHIINNKKTERSYNKVFCIGFGKTGTTSLENALSEFGFRMGHNSSRK